VLGWVPKELVGLHLVVLLIQMVAVEVALQKMAPLLLMAVLLKPHMAQQVTLRVAVVLAVYTSLVFLIRVAMAPLVAPHLRTRKR
jgi:hypothetical protein